MSDGAPRRRMLDTNAVSQAIRGVPAAVRVRLQSAPPAGLCISSITEGELRFGLARRPGAVALAHAVGALLDQIAILSWDSAAADSYGRLRATLETAGRPLGNLDTLIAAHALAIDAILVTSDGAFSHAPGLEIENWTK